jgi:hypothetical protein
MRERGALARNTLKILMEVKIGLVATAIGIGTETVNGIEIVIEIETENVIIVDVRSEMAITEIEVARLEGMDEVNVIGTIETAIEKETREAVGLRAVRIIMEGAVPEMGVGFRSAELAEAPIFKTF